jgi:CHAT domain-containing protein
LPIHAAGDDGKRCSDYVVSSYTPTISSLLGARKGYAPVKKQDIKALVAAVPRSFSPLWDELASTVEEISSVKAALPEGTCITIPGPDGTPDGSTSGVTAKALLEKLPEATILHLACHGRQDPENALNSGFVMSDEIVTIERLMQIPLPRALMAFLSACETAKGDQVKSETNAANLQHTYSFLLFRISLTKPSIWRRPCYLQVSRA